MKFYVAQKQVAKDYVILTGVITRKVNEKFLQEIHKEFIKVEDYQNAGLKENFPFIIDIKNSWSQHED